MSILSQMNKLVTLLLDMLKGHPTVHFTTLCAINRVIDVCIVQQVYHPWEYDKSAGSFTANITRTAGSTHSYARPLSRSGSGWNDGHDPNHVHSQLEKIIQGSPLGVTTKSSPKCRPASWKSRTSHNDSVRSSRSLQHQDSCSNLKETSFVEGEINVSSVNANANANEPSCDKDERTPIDMIMSSEPGQILEILQKAINLHKQTMGTRHKCSPSVRWRNCQYHCLQILSARVLTVMSHGNSMQHKLVNDAHIRILVDALDPNHDPVSDA